MFKTLLTVILWASLCVSANAAGSQTTTASLDTLTLEQKVGQLFIFGFPGTTLSSELEKTIKTLKPGALLLFGRNITSLKQTAQLNAALQQSSLKHSHLPLFLAVDQEGGAVARIHTSPGLPNAYTIGGTNEPTLAFQAGKVTGQMLHALGFNMNLAPVLDITDEQLSSFVGARSFSESPRKISSMGVAFAQGLSEMKILPVAKHFPGHGPIAFDSHHMTPTRNTSYGELMASDLVPFMQFASANMDSGIMVAHIAFPNIDKSDLPATYSHKMISEILTEQLKYKGLVMTDDIEMAGASSFKRVEDRAVAAIRAGNDLVMVGWSPKLQKRAVNAVISAVKDGTISMERLNKSVKKILALKNIFVVSNTERSLANDISPKEAFKRIPYTSVFNEIIGSYFKKLPGLESSTTTIKKMYVVSNSKNFLQSFKRWSKNPNVSLADHISPNKVLKPTDVIVYHISSLRGYTDLRHFPFETRKKMILVSSHSKVRVQDKTSFLDVVEVYSNHPNLGGYTAEVINRQQSNVAVNSTYFYQ